MFACEYIYKFSSSRENECEDLDFNNNFNNFYSVPPVSYFTEDV